MIDEWVFSAFRFMDVVPSWRIKYPSLAPERLLTVILLLSP
jgi:hypothetical protein